MKYILNHEKQYQATANDKAIRALFWGNRVGKTEWGAQEVARYTEGYKTNFISVYKDGKVIDSPIIPRKVIFPIEIWCACPSFDLQKDTTQKKLERYLPKERIQHISYISGGIWKEVILTDGVRLNFKSYEQGREKFQGAGKRVIWFDEEPPRDIWEECFVRTEAGVPLDIIMTMTPINGMTWVYDEIYLDTNNDDLFVSEAEWNDNPWLEEGQKAKMQKGLTPQALEVRKKGKFVKKTGLVCPWWQRGIHCQAVEYKSEWAIYGALDFGFSNPACFLLIGVDYDDNLFILDGFYERGLTSPDIAIKVAALANSYNIDMNNLTIIADSAQAQSIQELNNISANSKYGFGVIGVTKVSGTDGENWDEFRADKMQQYGEVTKEHKTKVAVSNNLIAYDEKVGNDVNWFVKEIENLKWAEVASSQGKEKQQGARWDSRYANHAIDAFSYFVVYNLGAPDKKTETKVGAGKIPGTYTKASIPEEDANFAENMIQFDEIDLT